MRDNKDPQQQLKTRQFLSEQSTKTFKAACMITATQIALIEAEKTHLSSNGQVLRHRLLAHGLAMGNRLLSARGEPGVPITPIMAKEDNPRWHTRDHER